MQHVDSVEDRVISRLQSGHPRIHLCVHQPEGERFVSYQGLVVAFVIGNVFLSIAGNQRKVSVVPSICDGVRDVRNVPQLQLAFLHQFDPLVYRISPHSFQLPATAIFIR